MGYEIKKLIPGTKLKFKTDYMFVCDKHGKHYDWECPVCKLELEKEDLHAELEELIVASEEDINYRGDFTLGMTQALEKAKERI
jgi:hypothetical protein